MHHLYILFIDFIYYRFIGLAHPCKQRNAQSKEDTLYVLTAEMFHYSFLREEEYHIAPFLNAF